MAALDAGATGASSVVVSEVGLVSERDSGEWRRRRGERTRMGHLALGRWGGGDEVGGSRRREHWGWALILGPRSAGA